MEKQKGVEMNQLYQPYITDKEPSYVWMWLIIGIIVTLFVFFFAKENRKMNNELRKISVYSRDGQLITNYIAKGKYQSWKDGDIAFWTVEGKYVRVKKLPTVIERIK